MKGKGERERYTQLNAEFQRIAKRDKKAFLSEQCKEIKENKEWKRLEISSRKLEYQGNISFKGGHSKVQKWQGPSGHMTGKSQFSFQSQGKAMPKNVQTTLQLHSFNMLSRLC